MEFIKKLVLIFCVTYTIGYAFGSLLEWMDAAGLFPAG